MLLAVKVAEETLNEFQLWLLFKWYQLFIYRGFVYKSGFVYKKQNSFVARDIAMDSL